MKKSLFYSCVFVLCAQTLTVPEKESFIIEKPKRVSNAKQKEKIGDVYADLATLLSTINCLTAECIAAVVDRSKDLYNGDVSSNPQKLEKHRQDLNVRMEHLKSCKTHVRSLLEFLEEGIPA